MIKEEWLTALVSGFLSGLFIGCLIGLCVEVRRIRTNGEKLVQQGEELLRRLRRP